MQSVHFLRDNPAFYRANHAVMTLSANLSTGFPALDRMLPGGGWPTGAVTEILAGDGRIDPVNLLLPALATLSWERRWLGWIAPPHPPAADELRGQGLDLSRLLVIRTGAPATSTLDVAGRAMQTGRYAAVLVWADSAEKAGIAQLQRAARAAGGLAFVFRSAAALGQASPAELRLYVTTHCRRLGIEIVQCQGGPGASLQLAQSEETPLLRPQMVSPQAAAAGDWLQ